MSIVEDLVRTKIKDAESGDVESAWWCLEEFCNSINAGLNKDGSLKMSPASSVVAQNPNLEMYKNSQIPIVNTNIDPLILIYLKKCFEFILEDREIDVAKALGLKHDHAGAPKKDTSYRDIGLCQSIMTKITQGMSVKEALRLTAAEYDEISQSTLKKIWYNAEIRLTAEWVDELLKRLKDK